MKTDEIRAIFLEFFKSKGHQIVPSDSLVPKDDPTLLFTGAGMNQFKDKFLGKNITYSRATTSQKCLRTADLENVGRTTGHHTFFEMLGNFSFGDYFKKDAILWAWEFLTKKLKIKESLLWASVYKDDDEAYKIWKDSVKIPESRIIKFGEKENFWPSSAPTKGPNGPCGPCSEIFYDYGPDTGCGKTGCTPACDCGRFVEIWNLVFTQFDRQPDGSLKPLPNKNIDTGMGLERLASVMQGVKTNFEIDIFIPIAKAIRGETRNTDDKRRVNAVADHIRAVTFMIADGVMPSNEERGYVARKLIRRAMSHLKDLGIKEPYLYKLVSIVTEVMQGAYPVLKSRRDDIAQIVKKEEENFIFILAGQIPKVEDAFKKIKNKKELAEAAFNFYDTYGMPYEMLEEMAGKLGLDIDKDIFESLLEKQRETSRAKSKIKGEIFTETFAHKVEALGLKTEFLGYEKFHHADAKVIEVLGAGEVILDKTPFYGESGGQAGDWGTIETKSGRMEVEDAKKIGDTIVHIGRMLEGNIVKGQTAKAQVNETARKNIMSNHTATHLLQAALRKVLGDHVRQTGSLVDGEHLRFDFTHMKKMEEREILRVEEIVNENIKAGIKVKKEIKDIESAKREGATALFDEKYGNTVRVITIGDVSKELCGGTHADNTKDINIFRITSESSIASGVRRIEAVTGDEALGWMKKQDEIQNSKLKIQNEKDKMKKVFEERLAAEVKNMDSIIGSAKDIRGSKIVCRAIKGFNMESLRALSDRIKARLESSVIVLATDDGEKASFIVSISDDLLKNGITAGKAARELALMIDGSGGGKDSFAQGGGKSPLKLPGAMDEMVKVISGKIKGV